jgi:hypothetical protein
MGLSNTNGEFGTPSSKSSSSGGSGTVTSVSNVDGTITVSGTPNVAPVVSLSAAEVAVIAAKAPLASPALTGTPTAPTATPGDNTTQIATDAFVTNAISNAVAGINPAVAVQAATTLASNTSGLTYANGVGGVGATFTGTANTPIVIDGITLNTVGQRLLVKNDTQAPSGAFNGIYVLTIASGVGIAPVFTRALDYDQPSDMNNTGAIPVQGGTVNAVTSWLLTSQVVTVGTTPLVFAKFTNNPSGGGVGALTQIANSVLASAAASITFSAIPGTANHLELIAFGRSSNAAVDNYQVTVNSVASGYFINGIGEAVGGSNYLGASATAAGWSVNLVPSIGNGKDLPGTGATAGVTGQLDVKIFGYAATTFNKSGTFTSGYYDGVTGTTSSSAGTSNIQVTSTAAVTSVTLKPLSGSNFVTGTSAYLYGIT